MSEITRDDVQAGDVVHYGCLGYHHEGVARVMEDGDGGLTVNRGGQWYADFIRAERPAAPLTFPEGEAISGTPRTGR